MFASSYMYLPSNVKYGYNNYIHVNQGRRQDFKGGVSM